MCCLSLCMCACLLSYCCSWRANTHTHTHNCRCSFSVHIYFSFFPFFHCWFVHLFHSLVRSIRLLLTAAAAAVVIIVTVISKPCRSLVRAQLVYMYNLVCASRALPILHTIIYFSRVHIIPSTAAADYIETDWFSCCLCTCTSYIVHCIRYMSVCSGCFFYNTQHKERWYCTRLLADWLRVWSCSIFTILMVGPVTSDSSSRECDITYFVWPIILDVNGLSRSKDVATCCVGYSIFYYYLLCISL